MKKYQLVIKRTFDIVVSIVGLVVMLPFMVVLVIILKMTTHGPAFYVQARVGRDGVLFKCVKLCTMKPGSDSHGTVTTASDRRITVQGRFLRKFKLDEFPQLWNVLIGRMSFVGPRPDVPGYADKLVGEDRELLHLRPGITGPASVVFRYEEQLLAESNQPAELNDKVLWPAKVRINLMYCRNYSFFKDLGYIIITLLPAANSILHLLPKTPRSLVELESTLKKFHFE